jgi:hypothetical protein
MVSISHILKNLVKERLRFIFPIPGLMPGCVIQSNLLLDEVDFYTAMQGQVFSYVA